MVMMFNATFNNISVISWLSVLLVEETGENHRSSILAQLKPHLGGAMRWSYRKSCDRNSRYRKSYWPEATS